MDIAFLITSTGWGGLEMNTLKLGGLLKQKGYNICLITHSLSTIYKKCNNTFSSIVLIDNIKKHFDFKNAKKIAQNLKHQKIKTILVFDNKDLDVIALTKYFFYNNLNIVYQQHMQIGINKKDILHTLRFKAVNYWISPLQYLKNEIAERTKYPVNRVKVIPLCLNTNKFSTAKYTKAQARTLLNINNETIIIGIIGRISEKKGQLFLVEALNQLIKLGNNNIELLIFGSATVNDPESKNYDNNLRLYVNKNNLSNRVHFVEYTPDVSLFYNSVDIFALASHSETYGMVTIEAMLAGIPVIATKSGGTSEILEYGNLGQLYEYNNQPDFIDKILFMLNNKTEIIKTSILAKKTALLKYSQNIEIEQIDDLIKSLY